MRNTKTPAERIKIWVGDITTLKVDAIVNAANESLLGGGGVDGAIHRAAGPKLLVACSKLNGCPTGEAKITLGFDLPAKFIIHTVGPRYSMLGRETLLDSCYRNCLDIAVTQKIKSVAFPAISTGVFGYPMVEATKIAFYTVARYLDTHFAQDLLVTFVCFDEAARKIYQAEYDQLPN